ncbi:hypothetical protein MW887_004705 [Aspergillus wentii]|nr:hypothetical protein MW887_004705 [Aspergillus wentii]
MGPLLAAYAVPTNWRWPLWEIVIIAAPSLIVMVCLLAETSHETILLHRAQRLRRINPHILAPSETRRHGFKNILVDALIKPVEILIKDPAIAYISAYTSLVYATYYSFFQALPIAFGRTYRMFAGSQRLMFLTIVAILVYVPLTYPRYVASLFAANDFVRSIVAAGFVMFTRYTYDDLGIVKGMTLLAGLSVGGILGMIFIYSYGGRLRARGKFAAKD